MIDFRYHIVSIVAVFLALALGLVLGTVAVDPFLLRNLEGRFDAVVDEKEALQADVEKLRDGVADGEAFAKAATEPLVRDQLGGRSVVLISLPETPGGMRDELVDLLTLAGASVSARISISDRYADPARDDALGELVAAATPSGVVLNGASASQRSGQLLALALTGRSGVLPGVPLPPNQSPTASRPASPSAAALAPGTAAPEAPALIPILEAYADADLLTIDADDPAPAEIVLVLTDGPPKEGSVADAARYLDLIGALAGSPSTTVTVAGPTPALDAGVVDEVRGSGLATVVSTVDGAETPYGLIATIRAMRAQLFGVIGRYGVGGDDEPLPEPVDEAAS